MIKTTTLNLKQLPHDGILVHLIHGQRELITVPGKETATLILTIGTAVDAAPLVQVSGIGILDMLPARLLDLVEKTSYFCELWENSDGSQLRLASGKLYVGEAIAPYGTDTPSQQEIEEIRLGLAALFDTATAAETTLNGLITQTTDLEAAAALALERTAYIDTQTALATAAADQATAYATKPTEILPGIRSAKTYSEWADADRIRAEAAATTSSADAISASADASLARNAAEAAVPAQFPATKADADALLPTLSEGTVVEVQTDETASGLRTRYKVTGGTFDFLLALSPGGLEFRDVSALLSFAGTSGYGVFAKAGDIWTTRVEQFSYEIAASTATDVHLDYTATGGVKLRVLGRFSLAAFGAVGDGAADDTVAIQLGVDKLHAMHLATGETYRLEVPNGTFIHRPFVVKAGVVLSGEGGVLKFKDGVAIDTTVNYYPISDLGYDNAGFENLILEGNGANNLSARVCDSLTITGKYSWAHNVTIRDAPDSGIMFSAAEGGWIDKIRIDGARDVGVYVNNAENTTDSEGGWIGRVWAYDCVYSGLSFKRSSTRMSVGSIFAKRCGNAVAFESFGVTTGGAPSLLQIEQITGYDIGYMHRAAGAAESLITANRATNVYIGSVIGRNVSGIGLALAGCENFVVGHVDITGYATDPKTTGHGNTGVVMTARDAVNCSGVKLLSGKLAGFVTNGVLLQNTTASRVLLDSVAATVRGLRVEASTSDCVITGTYDGGTVDLEFFSGAANVNLSGCFFPDKTGTIEQRGGQRNASVTSPIGIIAPRYIGELIEVTAGAQRYLSTGFANTDWLSIGPMFATTDAAIASATNAVNTQGKHIDKRVWDNTNNREMRATGTASTSAWVAVDGSVTVTPV